MCIFNLGEIMKILFLIRSLEYGGAERQLVELAKGLYEKGCGIRVLVFYSGGPLERELFERGIPVIYLNKKGRWDVIPFIIRIIKVILSEKPSIVHSYLGTSNILVTLLKPFFPRLKTVWGVRASNMDLTKYDWLSRLSYWLECRLSNWTDLIITNSFAGKAYAISNGFPAEKITVIQNGFDINMFCPNKNSRVNTRNKWKVSDEICIGIVGRLDPMKDHHTFFRAMKILISVYNQKNIKIICVGNGSPEYKESLINLTEELNIEDYIIWQEMTTNVNDLYNGLDMLVSSSLTEGFSNVIAEAMACGVPCIVTDVGDSALIVNNSEYVVPPQSAEALAEACDNMIKKILKGKKLGDAVRTRIVDNFSHKVFVDKTFNQLKMLIKQA